MDTSDDVIGLGGGGAKMPSVQAEQAKRTAEPVKQVSEQAKRNKRLAASLLISDWSEPKLSETGLLGW